ncbi:MAG TPA: hypothetical protein VGG56_09025 [Terracidiphilus sp.]|jgi:hypothetical protein
MTRLILPHKRLPIHVTAPNVCRVHRLGRAIILYVAVALAGSALVSAQITVNSKTGTVTNDTNGRAASTVDRRYQQITPTKVPLTKSELDAKTRLELLRLLQAEQGFAMRPFPRGHKGLTLAANGKLQPAGEDYVAMVTSEGISANPGDRVVITDLKFDHSKIIFEFNGGPDPKHRFLRHIQLGTGPMTSPVIQGDDQEPVGSRLTLTFQNHVPELTGSDVKALLAPLISFDVKTPIQAYTDTLPTKLKEAILNHHVLVGMSTDMVLFARGAPDNKSREMDGQMPFEEWIYGKPPNEVDFVRINGNRVIRVEVAKMGVDPVIFTKDEVEGLMRTDGTPLEAAATQRVAEVGDVQRDPNTQAPGAPPSLRNPGEKLPSDSDRSVGVMKPVQFPKQKPDPQPGTDPDGVPDAQPATTTAQPAPADTSQQAPAQPPAAKPQMWQLAEDGGLH